MLQIRRAAACLAKDLPALRVHLEYPLRLRKRLRSTNLLERSLGDVKLRTKVIGRFPGETRCLSLCLAVLDLFTASARGLELTALTRKDARAILPRPFHITGMDHPTQPTTLRLTPTRSPRTPLRAPAG